MMILLKVWLVGVGALLIVAPSIIGYLKSGGKPLDEDDWATGSAACGSAAILWPIVIGLGSLWLLSAGWFKIGANLAIARKLNQEAKLAEKLRDEAKLKQEKLWKKVGD